MTSPTTPCGTRTWEPPLIVTVFVRSNESIKDALARHGFTLEYPAKPDVEWPIVNTFTQAPPNSQLSELDARIIAILKPL